MSFFKTYKLFVWAIVIGQLALLAHAFIPHHHHQDTTVFLTSSLCSNANKQAEGHDHIHHHGQAEEWPCTESDECKTLNHTLLEETSSDLSSPSDFGILMPIALSALTTFQQLPTHLVQVRFPWINHYKSEHYVSSSGLRGPPNHFFSV